MKLSTLMMTMAAVGMVAGLALVGCSEGTAPGAKPGDSAKPSGTAKASPTSTAGEIAQKLCPVTGAPINPNIFVEYEGKKIYFCCPMCPPEFKKDPAKYVAKMEDQMKNPPPAKTPTPTSTGSAAVPPMAGYWTCSMHPEVHAAAPGKCPKCGMELTWKAVEPTPSSGTTK